MERSQIKYDIPDEWLKNRDKGLCPVCAKTKDEFEPRRQVYCSEKCANKYQSKIITWGELRDKILGRDGKICAKCNVNDKNVKIEEEKLYEEAIRKWKTSGLIKEMKISILKEIAILESFLNDEEKLIKEKGTFFGKPYDFDFRIDADFHVDHIKAIVNGGDMWDEKNLQVLCSRCHKKKTAKDMKKRTKGNKKLMEDKD